ncbi:cytochrome C [Sulfuricaulis limicola]|uniref:Cytochrome C n=1 Tax=Sulfuricaulis limicola TaxID=1620215 RepID=A0A1B4XCP0_9GAMM|nr:cytochrome c [Sulfuricaulis limicola]BAV32587.1 cytochrome C [Sulfuricaulis limicola]
MRRPRHKTGIILAALSALWSGTACAEISASRQAELMHLLVQDCGSCHGLTLKGGLGPALTREALNGKAPIMLREVILHGRPGTPMPPWKSFMSAPEADWLVQVLLEGTADAP